jgi:hypothetical protein
MARTESNGGRRRQSPPAADEPDAKALEVEVSRIARMNIDELRATWRMRFRNNPPDVFSGDLLARTLAWRIQEESFGGVDASTKKLLARMADGRQEAVRHLKAGSVLVREYRGTTHEVTVVPGGFSWNGTVYASLSAVARTIAGTAWNGPRFFGLRDKPGKKLPAEIERGDGTAPPPRNTRGAVRPAPQRPAAKPWDTVPSRAVEAGNGEACRR